MAAALLLLLALAVASLLAVLKPEIRSDGFGRRRPPTSQPDWTVGSLPSTPYAARPA